MSDNTQITTATGTETVATDDIAGVKVQRVKVGHGADGSYTDASAASPLPVAQAGVATETTLLALVEAVTGQQASAGQPVALDSATLAALEQTTVTVSGTVPVSGTFYPATQPVSGTVAVSGLPGSPAQEHSTAASPHSARLTDGTSYIGSTAQRLHVDDGGSSLSVDDNGGSLTVDGSVSVSNFPATQAVTGTFYPATQPVSGTVTVANPTTAPETGLAKDATLTSRLPATNADGGLPTHVQNFPATQQVSGTVGITGTVPVSGTLTDSQLRATPVPVSLATAPSTPVTGTFWQATQPVSGPLTDNSTGNYHADLDIPSSAASVGGWQYRFEGTGSVADADEGQFDVRESDFYA